nr:MAG TPA: hypothetical protein [Caudoviricetes sp.]
MPSSVKSFFLFFYDENYKMSVKGLDAGSTVRP